MAKSETAAQFAKAKVAAAQIGKARAAFDPKWKDVVAKLRAAIKAKQNDKIDLYLAALDGRIKELNKILRAATLVRGNLREIELDEDFVAANLAEVEKAVTTVSDAVDGLTEQFDDGKTLQNEAEAASTKFQGGANQAMTNLSALENEMDEAKDELSALFRKQDPIHSRAAKALDSRDAKGLAKAQADHAALGIGIALMLHEGRLKRVKEFGEKAASNSAYSEDLKKKLKDGVKDIQNKAVGVNVYVEQLALAEERVKAMKIGDIDIGKAAKALSIDRAGEAGLKKVLAGPSTGFEPGLDAIGRKLDPKQKGKDMLAKLKSAGVL
jgi:chromosome segregation ATPase